MTDPERATIYSVAERANVSIATVSRTLSGSDRVSEASRQRVLEAVRELDYIPDRAARSLAVKRHAALGLVLPELGGYYYPELLAGFESFAAQRRMSVVLLVAGQEASGLEQPLIDLCARVDAIAVMNGAGMLDRRRLAAIERRMPVVVIGESPGRGDVVTTGSRENARLLTAHLVQHGRRRLVFAGDPGLAPDAAARWRGFETALVEAGLPVGSPQPAGFNVESGQALGRRIADGDLDCDAVVCVNDDVALGLCLELRRRSVRVPDDIAVTGWDDVPATRYTSPGITTVAQPVRDLGRAAAARLVGTLDGRPVDAPSELPTRIVIRGSCGCPETPPEAPRNGGPQKEYS